jgi:hypothetical protein
MLTRYDCNAPVQQLGVGRYVMFAEHEALVQELLETLDEYFKMIEKGELTAESAMSATKAFIRMR